MDYKPQKEELEIKKDSGDNLLLEYLPFSFTSEQINESKKEIALSLLNSYDFKVENNSNLGGKLRINFTALGIGDILITFTLFKNKFIIHTWIFFHFWF